MCFKWLFKLGIVAKIFPFILDSSLIGTIRFYLLYYAKQNQEWGWDIDGFYSQNAERINAVVNILADEKSKYIYTGMIKFRQTRDKKDYPFHVIKETSYFIKELNLGENEVIIDCGAYDGDTIDQFLKHCPKYKQIIAFEPNSEAFHKLKQKHGDNPKIVLHNVGVYDKNGEVPFDVSDYGDSSVMDDKENNFPSTVQVIAIDDLHLEKVTFIKMDVEGSELNALKGAKETIIRDHPKLAICIYHTLEDMICIAEYIHTLVPEYKLYVRQYDFIAETVLYAIS